MTWNRQTGNWLGRQPPKTERMDKDMLPMESEITIPRKALFTLPEVAFHCGVGKSSVDRWIQEGKLKVKRLPNNYRRVTYAEFVKFLEQYLS